MYKLRAAIKKEMLLLIRDRVGLLFMFAMPVILVVVMTAVQNSTFELVNNNKIKVVLCLNENNLNNNELVNVLQNAGMFTVIKATTGNEKNIIELMRKHDALAGLIIPVDYFKNLKNKAQNKAQKALLSFGVAPAIEPIKITDTDSLQLYFQPVLHESYRGSIRGALLGALQIIENKLMIEALYTGINNKPASPAFEMDMMQGSTGFAEKQASYNGRSMIPNASQHNVPAWTLFAMFFTVISLGGNMVREKRSGSFIRLKLLPTNYMLGLLAKQIVYLAVALIQVLFIFSIGVWIFPLLSLPVLNIPSNIATVLVVSLVCGWCAVSYALCIGVFAQTYEQANGFGAASVVILAAFGGVFVPAFAMPQSFTIIIHLSPFYWGLESFYGLFLENKNFSETLTNILPLIAFALIFQLLAFTGLKKKNLI